jgi:hypothetical protein
MSSKELCEVREKLRKNKSLLKMLKDSDRIDFKFLFKERFVFVTKTTIPNDIKVGVYSVENVKPVPWHYYDENKSIVKVGGVLTDTLDISTLGMVYVDYPVKILTEALDEMVESRNGDKLPFGYYLIHSESEDMYVVAGLYRNDGYWVAGKMLQDVFTGGSAEYCLEFDKTKRKLTLENISKLHPPRNSEVITIFNGDAVEYTCFRSNFGYWYLISNKSIPIRVKELSVEVNYYGCKESIVY